MHHGMEKSTAKSIFFFADKKEGTGIGIEELTCQETRSKTRDWGRLSEEGGGAEASLVGTDLGLVPPPWRRSFLRSNLQEGKKRRPREIFLSCFLINSEEKGHFFSLFIQS